MAKALAGVALGIILLILTAQDLWAAQIISCEGAGLQFAMYFFDPNFGDLTFRSQSMQEFPFGGDYKFIRKDLKGEANPRFITNHNEGLEIFVPKEFLNKTAREFFVTVRYYDPEIVKCSSKSQ